MWESTASFRILSATAFQAIADVILNFMTCKRDAPRLLKAAGVLSHCELMIEAEVSHVRLSTDTPATSTQQPG